MLIIYSIIFQLFTIKPYVNSSYMCCPFKTSAFTAIHSFLSIEHVANIIYFGIYSNPCPAIHSHLLVR